MYVAISFFLGSSKAKKLKTGATITNHSKDSEASNNFAAAVPEPPRLVPTAEENGRRGSDTGECEV